MIDAILQNGELYTLVRQVCEENGCSVYFSDSIDPDRDMVLLRIDAFYNTRTFAMPPPAIDFLAVLRQKSVSFCLILIELRNVSSTKGIDPRKIHKKFETAIEDFMKKTFSSIFLDETHRIAKFRLFFVTDPLNLRMKGIDPAVVDRKYKETKLAYFNSMRPFSFKNHAARIEHLLPNSVLDTNARIISQRHSPTCRPRSLS